MNILKTTSVLILLLLVSCSLLISPKVYVFDSPYPEEDVVTAVDNFSEAYEEENDVEISYVLNNLQVTFYEKSEKEWSTPGCITGTVDPYTYKHIYVAYKTFEYFPLKQTTIWHELTHVFLYWTTGDPDLNHEQPGGPWTDKDNDLIRSFKQ